MNAETIRETMRFWEADPGKANGRPLVRGRSDGPQAVLESGSFSWRADLPRPLGGTGAAPTPTALLLGALAGSAVVVIRDALAPLLGVRVDAIEAVAQCRSDGRGLLGMPDAVAGLEGVRVDVRISTPDGDDALGRLQEAWMERSPVFLALTRALPVAVTCVQASNASVEEGSLDLR